MSYEIIIQVLTDLNLVQYKDLIQDNLSNKQLREIEVWLQSNKGPPAKVFEKLNQSFHTRKLFFRTSKDFSDIVTTWPRLFDVDSAIQNDFSRSFELIADNLIMKWKVMSQKIIEYAAVMRKSFYTIGISASSVDGNPDTAALFLLPFLVRPRNRSTSQIQSVDAFIKVCQDADVDSLVRSKQEVQPQVLAIGRMEDLAFQDVFVIFKGKATKCNTILDAVDLAFKSYYIFNIEFPSACFGAYQFLDHHVFKMKLTCTVLSAVKELSAFVSDAD